MLERERERDAVLGGLRPSALTKLTAPLDVSAMRSPPAVMLKSAAGVMFQRAAGDRVEAAAAASACATRRSR